MVNCELLRNVDAKGNYFVIASCTQRSGLGHCQSLVMVSGHRTPTDRILLALASPPPFLDCQSPAGLATRKWLVQRARAPTNEPINEITCFTSSAGNGNFLVEVRPHECMKNQSSQWKLGALRVAQLDFNGQSCLLGQPQ